MRHPPIIAHAPEDAGGAAPQDGAPPAAEAPAPAEGGLLDAVPEAPPPGADGKPGRPDWLPEQFWDVEKAEARVQDLAKSQRDLRAMVSRAEHKPPATPEDYTLPPVEGVAPEQLAPPDDPVWGQVRQAAHKAGVTQAQLSAITQPYLAALAEQMRGQDPQAQQAAAAAAHAAELAKLGPGGEAVVRSVSGWLKGLESRGMLSAGEHRALRMVSTAEGVRALNKLAELAGEQPIPVEALDAGEMTQAEAQRLLMEGYAKGDEAMLKKGRARLEALERAGRLAL